MTALEWLAQPASRLVTLSLLHFLWQGLAICLLLVAVVELCNLRRATTRYACSLVALLAVTVSPMATLAWLAAERPAHTVAEFSVSPTSLGLMHGPHWLEAAQPAALAVWLMGVALFGGRLLAGAAGIARLRRGRMSLLPRMADVVERLGRRLRIEALPLVFMSKQITDAMAVGLIRPLVLIPAAWATEMPLPMLEAVIAHELAHLARRDLWVNLLQRIVETLLFYHPAVWWLSRRLRIERELCADEMAVRATGDRVAYAQALEHIASGQRADIRPALAAFLRGETDMRILQRVRNVLGQPVDERSRLWPAGIIALALPLGLWAAAVINSAAVADDDEPKKPTIKRERSDSDVETRVLLRKKIPTGDERQEEIVEERVIKRGGKPVVEVQLGRKELREDEGDRRIDELTALVKRLAARVERLQDEVASLRGAKAGQKQPTGEAELQLERLKKQAVERNQFEFGKQEFEKAAEKMEAAQRAMAEKQKVFAELAARHDRETRDRVKKELANKLEMEKEEKAAQASLEKAEAARKKAEAVRAIEEKIRRLKEGDEDEAKEQNVIRRKLREEPR